MHTHRHPHMHKHKHTHNIHKTCTHAPLQVEAPWRWSAYKAAETGGLESADAGLTPAGLWVYHSGVFVCVCVLQVGCAEQSTTCNNMGGRSVCLSNTLCPPNMCCVIPVCALQDVCLTFQWSRMFVMDEIKEYNRYSSVTFIDFLEALGRAADMKSLPDPEDIEEAGYSNILEWATEKERVDGNPDGAGVCVCCCLPV